MGRRLGGAGRRPRLHRPRASTIPVGGGYTAEMLLADADIALAELGQATVFGRGLGAYIALQLAGSRPADVHRGDPRRRAGPGRRGDVPDVAELLRRCRRAGGPPDPYALVEMSRDLRPPDYAAAFVRLALAGSPLDEPISVAAVFHPPWLEAVAAEPGVSATTIPEALARYAAGSDRSAIWAGSVSGGIVRIPGRSRRASP